MAPRGPKPKYRGVEGTWTDDDHWEAEYKGKKYYKFKGGAWKAVTDGAATTDDEMEFETPPGALPSSPVVPELKQLTIEQLVAKCQDLGMWTHLNRKNWTEAERRRKLIEKIENELRSNASPLVSRITALMNEISTSATGVTAPALASNDAANENVDSRSVTESASRPPTPLVNESFMPATGVTTSTVATGAVLENRDETRLASRVASLQPSQRDVIEHAISEFEKSNVEIEELRADVAKTSEENRKKGADADALIVELKMLEDLHRKELATLNNLQKLTHGGKFMKKTAYAKLLNEFGLITLCPGTPWDGQHVFHIIANSNGGPDHTDNYLYALGGTFNQSLGADHDCFIANMAGKEKARKAVKIALEVAAYSDDDLIKVVEKRKSGDAMPVRFTECSRHKNMIEKFPNDPKGLAEAMYNEGANLLRDVRNANRAAAKMKASL